MATRRKLPADVPYHTEHLWALIRSPVNRYDGLPSGVTEMMYLLAPSRKQLWDAIIEEEFYGTGHTKQSLQELGFVACEVFVEEVPK